MPVPVSPTDWWLDRILMEIAFDDHPDGLVTTRTSLGAVRITDGKIAEVLIDQATPSSDIPVVDAGGALIMPSFRDTHIHLDKTFYGGPWRTPIPGRFWLSEEERLLSGMSEQIPVRSNAILDLLVSNGTTDIVAHCNVDHIVGTKNVSRLLDVLQRRNDVDWQLVAYPQHGLRDGEIVPLLREALQIGATVVGGIDPARIEGYIDSALHTTFDLAVEFDVGVDFHLHDAGSLGAFEIEQVIRFTEEAGWDGRVSLSCANGLSGASPSQQLELAEGLARNGICVSLTAGVSGNLLPVDLLRESGVDVSLGSDSIMDILTPFGQGDILEQLWILTQRLGRFDERSIANALEFGAGEPGRWREDGTRGWPNPGHRASFFLTPASCTAEAIARRTERQAVYHHGVLVHESPQTRRS